MIPVFNTQTVTSINVERESSNLSELVLLSAGRAPGLSVDSHIVILVAGWTQYYIKFTHATSSNLCIHVFQFAISILSKSVFPSIFWIVTQNGIKWLQNELKHPWDTSSNQNSLAMLDQDPLMLSLMMWWRRHHEQYCLTRVQLLHT